MPSTLWEKLTEIRQISMLLKPRTMIRNYLANVPMVGMRKAADALSGVIQDALVRNREWSEQQQTRTARYSKEARTAALDYYTHFASEIRGSSIPSPSLYCLTRLCDTNITPFFAVLRPNMPIGILFVQYCQKNMSVFGNRKSAGHDMMGQII